MHIPEGFAAAFLIPALALLLGGWPWHRSRPSLASAVGLLGVAVGLFTACWLLDVAPRWPPAEDRDRLLFFLLPAVFVIEIAAAFGGRFRWLFWLPRLVVAAGAGSIVLYKSVYFTDWSGLQAFAWLGGLAAALAAEWGLLADLLRRSPGRSVPLAVMVAVAGAAVGVLLSGYATGGLLGLALATALAGMLAASLVVKPVPDFNGLLGVGIVGLFALVVAGHFFAELTTLNAALLFLAPLLAWLPELPGVRRAWPWVRSTVRMAIVLAPVVIALGLATQKSVKDLSRPSSGTPEPTADDYNNFGK